MIIFLVYTKKVLLTSLEKSIFICKVCIPPEKFIKSHKKQEPGKMNYLIDIDGTLLNGPEAIPGAVDFINGLTKNDDKFLLMTNSIKSSEAQKNRLADAGIIVNSERILNPISAINRYLLEMHVEKVKIIGSRLEIEQIKAKNSDRDYELVILLDFEKEDFGYKVIQGIIDDIEGGKEVITASRSTYYLKNGRKAVDTGAFVKIIEEITDKKIRNFGKPSREYFDIAGKILDEKADKIFVVGDDWKTDILGANAYGAKSVLIKTGKYQSNDEKKCIPFKIAKNLTDLLA